MHTCKWNYNSCACRARVIFMLQFKQLVPIQDAVCNTCSTMWGELDMTGQPQVNDIEKGFRRGEALCIAGRRLRRDKVRSIRSEILKTSFQSDTPGKFKAFVVLMSIQAGMMFMQHPPSINTCTSHRL